MVFLCMLCHWLELLCTMSKFLGILKKQFVHKNDQFCVLLLTSLFSVPFFLKSDKCALRVEYELWRVIPAYQMLTISSCLLKLVFICKRFQFS